MLLNAIPELVEMADAEGRTPLHMASLTQNVELLEGLLQMGANPNTLDLSQKTPVFAACEVRLRLLLICASVDQGFQRLFSH